MIYSSVYTAAARNVDHYFIESANNNNNNNNQIKFKSNREPKVETPDCLPK